MPMSVRLDAKTEQLVERLAKKTGQTKSEVIREAIGNLMQQKKDQNGTVPPYDKVSDLIGCIHGGPRDLSIRTGEKFRRRLLEKRVRQA
ncbi:ribbon-helix-helix protein, CopG family [Candidatus Nitrospira bockiana]